jgi:hypothetical protein
MKPDWHLLSEKLKGFYFDLKLADKFEKDEEYLRNAFEFTENLWFQQFDSIKDIKFIMLSEAPLFGTKRIYFYNPESEFTSFFYFDDLRAFYPRQDLRNDLQTIMERKKYVINSLNGKGFIILDLFPFALNEEDTAIVYRSPSKETDKKKLSSPEYRKLFDLSYSGYLKPKLRLIKSKAQANLKIVHRYQWLQSKIGKFIKGKISENEIALLGDEIIAINGTNMPLDRGKLESEYKKVGDVL